MNTKHTPGPWTIADDHAVAVIDGTENLYLQVGPCLVDATPLDDPEVEANARLIAAAPDLLAALERAELDLRDFADLEGEFDATPEALLSVARSIAAAIAKARGES